MYDIEKPISYIPLGNQRDFGHTVQFDLTAWADLNADDWKITYMRPGESATYPAPDGDVAVVDNVLTWTISEAVTAINGTGSVVIEAYRGGEMLKHSDRIMTIIGEGHEPAGEAPDPVADWIREADAKLDEVDESLERANSAEDLRETAEIARETAEGLRAGAETSRNTAEGLRASAETARNSAEGLRGSAETARKEAEALRVAADAVRMGFKPMGAYNPANENKYGEWYTHEGGSYGYIYPTPSTGVPVTETSHWQQIAEKGDNTYTHIKFSNANPSQDADMIDTPSAWMGIYWGGSASPPNNYTQYIWNRVKATPMPITWSEFQGAVRDGSITDYFAVGDQFNVTKGATNLVFDIVDIGSSTRNVTANGNAPKDPNYFANFPNAKPVTFLMHDVIDGVMFDNSEANYQITTEIASGAKCNISLESNTIAAETYNFTAPSALVVGGRLRISNATTLQYYATPAAAAVNIAMVAGAADAEYISIAGSLSAQNHKDRVSYGSNKYTESAIRQWLNAGGAAASFWVSKSNYDLAPSWHSTLAGFRNGLDPDLLAVLGETTREVELNTVTDGGGQATIADNIFLPSRMEIYGSVETAGHKGLQFQAYVGLLDIDKIKYDTTALSKARLWWVRSPFAGVTSYARIVNSATGALNSRSASDSFGAAAACVIL